MNYFLFEILRLQIKDFFLNLPNICRTFYEKLETGKRHSPFFANHAVKVVKVKMVIFNFGFGHLAHYI